MKSIPFKNASDSIGRRRLPSGLVAVLDDPESLSLAIAQLHEYATRNRESNRHRQGVVFRVVQAWESQAIRHKLYDYTGSKNISTYDAIFAVPLGHLHVLDDSLISHACNRHAAAETNPDLVMNLVDFQRIPEVIDPRHITEFSVVKEMPRIVYQKEYTNGWLVVVEEIQAIAGLSVKTIYKKK